MTKTSLVYRERGQDEDPDRFFTLVAAAFGEHMDLSPANLVNLLSQDHVHVLLAQAEGRGQDIAYILYSQVLDQVEIYSLGVHPKAQRQGIAQQMLTDFLCRIQEKMVFLEVRSKNHPARNLYTKLGFQETGLRKNYYQNPKDHAIIMAAQVEKGAQNDQNTCN